jgi:tetratricopeptide (TPR) repeat protein
MDAEPAGIFDPEGAASAVEELIERSHARPRGGWLLYAMGLFLLLVLGGTMAEMSASPVVRQGYELLSGAASFLILLAMMGRTVVVVRAQREELTQLEGVEELMALRRWPAAGQMLVQLLSKPMRTLNGRVQGLLYLTTLLARYNRFEESVGLANYLMENVRMDARTDYAIRLSRAMSLLREEQLLDADRAIGELRRLRGAADSAEEKPSAGLAMVELYRDVKTGHPAEAVENYEKQKTLLTRQLGHRVADAHGLAARAYDLLGREDDARIAYRAATLLAPAVEIHRRYPETAQLAGKYQAAIWPGEAA